MQKSNNLKNIAIINVKKAYTDFIFSIWVSVKKKN